MGSLEDPLISLNSPFLKVLDRNSGVENVFAYLSYKIQCKRRIGGIGFYGVMHTAHYLRVSRVFTLRSTIEGFPLSLSLITRVVQYLFMAFKL